MIKCPFLSQFTGPLPKLNKSGGEEPIVLFFWKAVLLKFLEPIYIYAYLLQFSH